jgi:membrane protein YqaA with SNARE-associated domain
MLFWRLTDNLSRLFHTLLHFVFHIGYFGPLLMGVLDSSFLFLPFGNDLLVIALVARRHQGYLLYVLAATCGSTLGVFLLDLVARKGGSGVEKIAGRRRFEYLKKKIGQHGASALILGCLAPPPFPFTMAVATLSALKYPRGRLVLTVAAGRAVRFLLLGFLALKFGRTLLRFAQSPVFTYSMGALAVLCVAGSVISISKWARRGRTAGRKPAEATV